MSEARRGLRTLRATGRAFAGRFHERDERHWPIAAAAAVFADRDDWPTPDEYAQAFGDRTAPVRFVRSEPARRPRGQPIDRSTLYDARILRGEVPTRERHWHDFLNALVWATFPRAKWALHERQHALIEAWLPHGATSLPNARTRPQDALALLDEGGIVVLCADDARLSVPFGHAFFEGLVLRSSPMVTRALPVEIATLPRTPAEAIACVDEALVARLGQPLLPEMMPRHALRSACVPWREGSNPPQVQGDCCPARQL